jgi:glutathione S-transferase
VTRDPDAFAWIVAPGAGKLVHASFKGATAVAGPMTRMRYGINNETAVKGREKTLAAFERLESEVGPSGYLVGDGFTVADLTAAALLFPLVRPPEALEAIPPGALPESLMRYRSELEGRPGFEWVREMYRRHRGSSVAIA